MSELSSFQRYRCRSSPRFRGTEVGAIHFRGTEVGALRFGAADVGALLVSEVQKLEHIKAAQLINQMAESVKLMIGFGSRSAGHLAVHLAGDCNDKCVPIYFSAAAARGGESAGGWGGWGGTCDAERGGSMDFYHLFQIRTKSEFMDE